MREVVTVQVGGFANYVGAHFWNFQDETLGTVEDAEEGQLPITGVDMDILYRVGETRQGLATYTPRLLAFDLRGSLGAVRAVGSLYERPPQPESSSVTTWSGPTVTYRQEPVEKNDFLQSLDGEAESWSAGYESQPSVSGNGYHAVGVVSSNRSGDIRPEEATEERSLVQGLDESVQFWTDYLKAHLHPQSVYELPNAWHGGTPFDTYGSGQGTFSQQESREEIENHLRFFVEECDHLQGFQFLVDNSGGFAAVAADFIEVVEDDYGRNPRLLFALRSPWTAPAVVNHRELVASSLHDAVSLARLSSLANLLVPVGLPSLASSEVGRYLCVNDSKLFHSSAVYAAAINAISLPFRMEVLGPTASPQVRGVGSSDIDSMVQHVSCSQQKKVALMQASLPGPAIPVDGSREGLDLRSLASLTPGVDISGAEMQAAEVLVIQGARLADARGPATVPQVLECTYSGQTAVRRGTLSSCLLSVSPSPLTIPLPFPCIFGPRVNRRGDILPNAMSSVAGRGGLDVVSAPVAARVTSSNSLLPYLKERLINIRKWGLSRVSLGSGVLEDWGIGKEETQDLAEILSDLTAAYGERMHDSSSDSD